MVNLQKNGITGGRLIIGGKYVNKELYMQSINPSVKDGRDCTKIITPYLIDDTDCTKEIN
jgi:hypothetical protein